MLLKKLKALTVMAFAMIMVAGAVFVINTSAVNAEDGQEFPYTELTFFFDANKTEGTINEVIREENGITVPFDYGDEVKEEKLPLFTIVVPTVAKTSGTTAPGAPGVKATLSKAYMFCVMAYDNYEKAEAGGTAFYATFDQYAEDSTDQFDMLCYDSGKDGKPDVFVFDEVYDEDWNDYPKFAVTFMTQEERTQELKAAAGDAEQLRTDLAKANLDLNDAIKELTQVRGDLTQALTDKETAETALKQAQGDAVTTLGKVSLKSAKGAKKKVTVKWKKAAGAAGYEVVIAKNKAGTKSASIYTVKKVSTVTKTVKGLAKGKYFVKVRAYKTYKGNTLYGAFSAAKKVTVK